MNAKIYFLQHGNPEPKIIEYDNVDTEEQFMNMMAMALIIGNEDYTFTDKAFGYWNDTWYHSFPSQKEDDSEIPNEIPDQCLACDGFNFKVIDDEDLDELLLQCLDCGNKQYPNSKIITDERLDFLINDYELTERAIKLGISSVEEVRNTYCKMNEQYDSCSVCSQWNRRDHCTLLKKKEVENHERSD